MEPIFKEESYHIMGACIEVHKEKGCGFLEAVYQECLEIEFSRRGIPFVSQVPVILEYKTIQLRQRYIPDFVCFGKIILELKAHKELLDKHRAQTINYLKATRFELAILINFGSKRLQSQRFINQY